MSSADLQSTVSCCPDISDLQGLDILTSEGAITSSEINNKLSPTPNSVSPELHFPIYCSQNYLLRKSAPNDILDHPAAFSQCVMPQLLTGPVLVALAPG